MPFSIPIASCAGGVWLGCTCVSHFWLRFRENAQTPSIKQERKKSKERQRRKLLADAFDHMRLLNIDSCMESSMGTVSPLNSFLSSSATPRSLSWPGQPLTPFEKTILEVEDVHWKGFSMEEAQLYARTASATKELKSPAAVMVELQWGNMRFWAGCARRQETSVFKRRGLIERQFLKAAVLGCCDLQVPIETIFDMGVGDIFVTETIGNVLNTSTLASLQYAVRHLNVKVVLVMGHEGCDAVRMAGEPTENMEKEPECLRQCLQTIEEGLDHDRLLTCREERARDRESVEANVRRQLQGITKDACIMEKIRAKELIVIGGVYELSSGIVDLFQVVENIAALNEFNTSSPSVQRAFSRERALPRESSQTSVVHPFQSLVSAQTVPIQSEQVDGGVCLNQMRSCID